MMQPVVRERPGATLYPFEQAPTELLRVVAHAQHGFFPLPVEGLSAEEEHQIDKAIAARILMERGG